VGGCGFRNAEDAVIDQVHRRWRTSEASRRVGGGNGGQLSTLAIQPLLFRWDFLY
jgi:hypothetical protein